MFKFLSGIVIIQLLTIAFVFLLPNTINSVWGWVQILLPTFSIAFIAAFWFNAIALQINQKKINQLQKQFGSDREKIRVNAERSKVKMQEKFVDEREKIRVNAERSKVRMLKKTQESMLEEARKVNSKANFKMGAITAGAVGVGVVLMTIQMLTMGMMILMTTGGILTGYAVRLRQEKTGKLPFSGAKLPFRKKVPEVLEQSIKKIPISKNNPSN